MKNINNLRKMSYLKLKSKFYELLYQKEVELDCLNKNFENAKEISKSYFIESGHEEENDKIYNLEMETLRYCLNNIRQYKRLNNEIIDVKKKLLVAENKLI